MVGDKKPDLSMFAAAGGYAGRAFAIFYQEFVDGTAYQLNQSEPNDVPVGGMAKCVNEVVAPAFIAVFQNIMDTYDQYGIPQQEPPSGTEETEQCAACWCNSCGKLEECTAFPASDGITPPPCAACWGNDPLVPVGAPPECGEYEPSAEALKGGAAVDPETGEKIRVACLACWCRDCGEFEQCTVEKDGYDPASLPCPCDACRGEERFMAREKPPTCGNSQPRAAE